MGKYRGKKVVRLNKERGAWGYHETKMTPKGTEIIMKPDPNVAHLFEVRREFEITVPEDFEASVYLKSFIKEYRRENRKERESFIQKVSMGYLLKNFSEKTHCGLERGVTYKGIVYESIKRGISLADCLNFIEQVKGFSPGAEGLALTLKFAPKSLWGIRSLVSFNNPKIPMTDEKGKEKAMALYRWNIPSCAWQLELIDADTTYGRSKNDCLLVFFKK